MVVWLIAAKLHSHHPGQFHPHPLFTNLAKSKKVLRTALVLKSKVTFTVSRDVRVDPVEVTEQASPNNTLNTRQQRYTSQLNSTFRTKPYKTQTVSLIPTPRLYVVH